MRRMDPDFAAAFSNENPEAYGATLREQRRRGATVVTASASAVHVPVIPPILGRFISGVIVMLLLIGAFFVISETSGREGFGIPSGQAMSNSAGTKFTERDASRSLDSIATTQMEIKDRISPSKGAPRELPGGAVADGS